MDALVTALGLVFDPWVIVVILLSAAFGLVVGAIPGLTATMATALLVPVAFQMEPVPALAVIVTATAMVIFAGDIPAAMLRMPGTPASVAYTNDSYLIARSGRLNYVLGTTLVFSTLGGLIGVAVLVLAAPTLAEMALGLSSFEYFWLALLGLSCACFIATNDPLKGFISLVLGLFIATIGMDPTAGYPRFAFGSSDLMSGVSFIPAMIGLFAVSEVLRGALSLGGSLQPAIRQVGRVFGETRATLRRYWLNLLRGSSIGAVVGALPGGGADIAAWISYAVSNRFSRQPEKYGNGHIEGITDASAANSAALGAAWIPTLVFGIPGDTITAIAIGVLYVKGINPGPTVFINNAEFIYAVFMVFVIANLLMLPLGWLAIKTARHFISIPQAILLPIVLVFCIIGSYAITFSAYGVIVMLVMGLIGWFMEENRFPLAPMILGLVLGEMLERSFLTSLIRSDGDLIAFFTRPVSSVLAVVTLLIWAGVAIGGVRMLARSRTRNPAPSD